MTSLNAPQNPEATLDQLTYADKVPEGTFQIVDGNFEIYMIVGGDAGGSNGEATGNKVFINGGTFGEVFVYGDIYYVIS